MASINPYLTELTALQDSLLTEETKICDKEERRCYRQRVTLQIYEAKGTIQALAAQKQTIETISGVATRELERIRRESLDFVTRHAACLATRTTVREELVGAKQAPQRAQKDLGTPPTFSVKEWLKGKLSDDTSSLPPLPLMVPTRVAPPGGSLSQCLRVQKLMDAASSPAVKIGHKIACFATAVIEGHEEDDTLVRDAAIDTGVAFGMVKTLPSIPVGSLSIPSTVYVLGAQAVGIAARKAEMTFTGVVARTEASVRDLSKLDAPLSPAAIAYVQMRSGSHYDGSWDSFKRETEGMLFALQIPKIMWDKAYQAIIAALKDHCDTHHITDKTVKAALTKPDLRLLLAVGAALGGPIPHPAGL